VQEKRLQSSTAYPWQTEHNTLHIKINEIIDVKYQILLVLMKEIIGDEKI
jgi:hypothetical protein